MVKDAFRPPTRFKNHHILNISPSRAQHRPLFQLEREFKRDSFDHLPTNSIINH